MKLIQRFLICILVLAFSIIPLAQAEGNIHDLIQSGAPLTTKNQLLGHIPHVDDNFRVLQGGCVNEEYGWFALIGADKAKHYPLTECYILKFRLDTMEEVARSQVLKLGHANDITYLPETNELYVIHVTGRQISILDADTLEIKGKKRMTTEAYALDYDPATQRIVIALGTMGMLMYNDLDLKTDSVCGYGFPLESTLVTQGICCDDTYIYHVLWSPDSNTQEPDNVIVVFDWEGKEITRIPIGLKGMEPENISLVNDIFYISFNQADIPGAELLYKMQLVEEE